MWVCTSPSVRNYFDSARKLAREAFLRTAIRQQIRHLNMTAVGSSATSAAPPAGHNAATSNTSPLTSEQLKEMAQQLELMSNSELKHLLLQLTGWTELATVNRLVLRSTAIVAQVNGDSTCAGGNSATHTSSICRMLITFRDLYSEFLTHTHTHTHTHSLTHSIAQSLTLTLSHSLSSILSRICCLV
jgi:hypothetical protein